MILEEAIEIVVEHQVESYQTEATDIHFALKLLIEAGKHITKNRGHRPQEQWFILPGETKE